MWQKAGDETQRTSSPRQCERRSQAVRHSLSSKTKREPQTLQVIEHRLHRLVSVSNLLCHCIVDDRGQIRRKVGVYLYCWFVWFVQHRMHYIDAAPGFERQLAS